MKRKLFTLATIVICLSILAGGTFANFTTEGTAHNVITSGKVDIELLEESKDGVSYTDIETGVTGVKFENVMPGESYEKKVNVENSGKEPAYVRIKVDKEIIKADHTNGDASLITVNFDTTNWTPHDGYYYYNGVLSPKGSDGDSTPCLFTMVTFAGETMGNEYQKSTATVNVIAEAIQKKNNVVMDGKPIYTAWPEYKTQQ